MVAIDHEFERDSKKAITIARIVDCIPREINMADDSSTNDKMLRMKALVDQLSDHIERSMEGTAGLTTRRKFDCGNYTCHGSFTCSTFSCGSNFKLAD